MLEAWAAADLDGAERLTATLTAAGGARLPPEVAAQARMLADLAAAVWDRARRRPHPRGMARWDAALRRGEPGEDVPLAAYALRGVLSLLGGHEQAAERFFRRLRFADYWRDALPAETLALAAYLRWVGFAYCWAQGVRGRRPCPDGCPGLVKWLVGAEAVFALLDGPAPPAPPAPPPAVAACPAMAVRHAGWVPQIPGVRADLGKALNEAEELGMDRHEALDALFREMVAPRHPGAPVAGPQGGGRRGR